MDPIIWPKTLLIPGDVKIWLQTASRGGGQTVDGNEQVVASPASQRWAITFSNVVIRARDQILAWRSIEALSDGRANSILVPVYDWSRGPLRSPFLPGLSVAAAPFVRTATAIALSQDAAVNATSLSVTWAGPAPSAGQYFSVGTSLYRVRSFAASGPGAAVLSVRPWFRAAAPAGTLLNFDDPGCLVRLAKDDGMALDLNLWRRAAPSVDFIEFF